MNLEKFSTEFGFEQKRVTKELLEKSRQLKPPEDILSSSSDEEKDAASADSDDDDEGFQPKLFSFSPLSDSSCPDELCMIFISRGIAPSMLLVYVIQFQMTYIGFVAIISCQRGAL
jgi:hypothetical protein